MAFLIQMLFDGIVDGLLISLVALGFQLIRLATRVLPVHLGGTFALTPYCAWASMQAGISLSTAVLVALASAAVHSVAFESLVSWPLSTRSTSPSAQLVAGLGALIVTTHGIILTWSVDPQVLSTTMHDSRRLLGISISDSQATALAATLATLLATFGLLRFSSYGLRLRAMFDDVELAAVFGVAAKRHRALTAALAGALVGTAALLQAWDLGFDSSSAVEGLLVGLVACTIGGDRKLSACIAGALALGLARSVTGVAFGAQWQEAASFALLVLALHLRSQHHRRTLYRSEEAR